MPSDHRLLRKYIRESLLIEKFDDSSTSGGIFSDVTSGIKGALGFGKGKGGPQKWFADFIGRQLDTAGEKLGDYLSQKLDDALPENIKANISQYEKQSGEKSAISLTKVVSGWIEEFEDFVEQDLKPAEKKAIYEFAAEEYSNLLKKGTDVEKALFTIKYKIDEKFGRQRLAAGNLKYLQQKKTKKAT
jgi:hypothetical protein